MTKKDTFTCAHCGRTFQSDRPDAEARAEAAKIFGPEPADDWAVVCDGCFAELMGDAPPPTARRRPS